MANGFSPIVLLSRRLRVMFEERARAYPCAEGSSQMSCADSHNEMDWDYFVAADNRRVINHLSFCLKFNGFVFLLKKKLRQQKPT